MNNIIVTGNGNKVAQPTQEMVATTNAQSESSNFATSNEIMLFVVEHEMVDCTDRSISKYHYFHNRVDAEKFRKYIITHQLQKMNLAEYFEYRYDHEYDTSVLSYVDAQSRFHIYRVKVSEPIEGIGQLSFKERAEMDDNFVEGQKQFIPNNFLTF